MFGVQPNYDSLHPWSLVANDNASFEFKVRKIIKNFML